MILYRKKLEAFTLVEILAATLIISILVATLGLVLGPIAKRKGYETRIRSDLHQDIGVIHMYMADNEGLYPSYMHSLGEAGYPYAKGVPELANYPGGSGPPEYMLMYTRGARLVETNRNLITHFDPASNALIKAEFFPRQTPLAHQTYFSAPGYGFGKTIDPIHGYEVLGGFMDGHVSWVLMNDLWESETRYYMVGVMLDSHPRHVNSR